MVSSAVQAQLEAWGLQDTAEGALALELAQRIDDGGNSATSVSMNAGRLLEALSVLRELHKVQPGRVNPLDEIRARRERRVSGTKN